MLSGNARFDRAPAEGVMFQNLDGLAGYDAMKFHAQSKLALALFGKELARRLRSRGICVNSVHPGITRRTPAASGPLQRLANLLAFPFRRSIEQAAATAALVAASPRAHGVSGEYWTNCRVAAASAWLNDSGLAARLWALSEEIVKVHLSPWPLQAAA
jgi:WW domain-containing oxidoreductase